MCLPADALQSATWSGFHETSSCFAVKNGNVVQVAKPLSLSRREIGFMSSASALLTTLKHTSGLTACCEVQVQRVKLWFIREITFALQIWNRERYHYTLI